MDAAAAPPIPVETLLLAYSQGIFPMADSREDTDIFWVEPRERAIFPLVNFRPSRSLLKLLRKDPFRITIDSAFEEVMRACAAPRPDHPESWISERIIASYLALHQAGHAHSLECWQGHNLVGGLYGVSFNQVFCGESMFSRADNASKIALCWLVALMRKSGMQLLDCQFMTEHLESLGAVSLPQEEYLERVRHASGSPICTLNASYSALLAEASDSLAGEVSDCELSVGSSSPGKLIAQSFTQTS